MWRVEFSPTAVQALDRLPMRIAGAIVEFCTTVLPTNPRRMTKQLRGDLADWHVARRGDYRVFVQFHETMGGQAATVEDEDGVLLIGRVEHRAHAYRPRG